MTTTVATSAENYSSNNTQYPFQEKTDEQFSYQYAFLVILLSIVIVIVVIGNTLVIAAVITTRRLRTVTNCFVMSLAVADWLVGIFVMPPAVANLIVGSWELGWILCDIWISLDILLCTASILSLCAISVDRYLAVTQPLRYSRKRRSKRLAFLMILVVWISSALITAPPMFGWYEPGRHNLKTCRYDRNTGYVIFSAMGSFFIPMIVMLYVYGRISCVIAQRHDQLGHINTSYSRKSKQNGVPIEESDIEKMSTETEEGKASVRTSSLMNDRNDLGTETPKKSSTRLLKTNTSYSFQNPRPLTPVKINNFRSGIEEEVSEIDDLLYTLLQLMNEFKSKPKKSSESSHQKGLNSREQALTNLMNQSSVQIENLELPANEHIIIEDIHSNPLIEVNYDVLNDGNNNSSSNNEGVKNAANKRTPTRHVGDKGKGGGKVGGAIFTPTRTRSSGGIKQSSIRFLEKKNERWFEIRSKEIALEDKKIEIEAAEKMKRLEMDERRLQMEEKRFSMEEKRLEMAEKRFKAEMEIFQNQQRLMEVAFTNCNCKKKS